MKYSKVTISIITAICCLFLAVPVYLDADEYSQGNGAGNEAGNSILSEINSGDAINQRMAVPITSSDTKMKTYGPEDQKGEFTAQMSAPSSDAFFVLFVQPAAGTGDLSVVTVRQDLNYDGEPDYVYTLASPVSGVCANGVISCTPGTWGNCHYFTWATDNNGKVALTEVESIKSLAGCYCINSSCGSNLVWNNLAIVLKDMGGAAVASVQNNDPHLTITSVRTADNAIYYYGQKTSEAGTASQGDQNYLSGSTTPEQYYGGNIPTDDEVFRQDQDTDSYYSLLVNSSAAQDSNVSMYTCTAKHNIVVDQIQCDSQPPISVSGNNWYQRWIRGAYVSGNTLYFRDYDGAFASATFTNTTPSMSSWWNQNRPINKITTSGNQMFLQSCKCTNMNCVGYGMDMTCTCLSISCDTMATVSFTSVTLSGERPYTYPSTNYNGDVICGGGASGNSLRFLGTAPNHYITLENATPYQCPLTQNRYVDEISCKGDCQTQSLSFNNQCNPAPSCRLKKEKVCDENGENCVQTRRNFSPTGLSPMPYCKTIDAIGHIYTACMDGGSATVFKDGGNGQILGSGENIWWHIERVYQCETDDEYDFDNLKQRTQHISDTTQDDTTSMYYEDYDPDSGTAEGHTIELPDRSNFDTCEKGCKVRRIVQDTQAGTHGTTADYRNSVSSYEDVYRTCNNGSCPVSDGETILVDCTCINEFNKAVSLMQVMDNASHDMICSEN